MSQLPSIPSKPPAAEGDLGAILQWVFTKFMQKTDGQLPAKVLSYDRVNNVAQVQPQITIISTSGQRVSRAPIAAVPVLALGGGGFFINFPLVAGDTGWIEASDRDISLFLQTATEAAPNSKFIHSFDNGRFVPDVFRKYSFAPDAGAMVISSLDGTTRVELTNGKATIVAPDVAINSQTVEVNATTSFTVNTGAYNVNATGSGTTVTGTVSLPTNTTIAGRPFLTHGHSGVQTGLGNSGGVV